MCIPPRSKRSKSVRLARNSSLAIFLLTVLSPDLRADTSELQALIDTAVSKGERRVTLPPGIIRLSEALRLENLRDFEITGPDTTLVMTVPREILWIDKCENLRIKGITIDYDPLPFTQGTITSMARDGMTIEFEIHEGYPELKKDMDGKTPRHFFDKETRLWKQGTNNFAVPKIEVLEGGRKGRALFTRPQTGVGAGDYICLDRRLLGQGSGVAIRNCRGPVEFEDVVVHASPALAFVGRMCEEQVVFRRVKIERGPRPPNATEDRLISTNADGVNFAFCRKGPVLENCEFSFMGDDSVNVHGVFLPIVRVVSPTEILVGKPGRINDFYTALRERDVIEIVEGSSCRKLGKAILKSIAPSPSTEGITPEEFATHLTGYANLGDPFRAGMPFTVYRLNLSEGADFIEPGQWLYFPAINCPDYVVKQSHFHDHRGTAMRLMGSNGRIEGNRFERIGKGAIQVGPELRGFNEAGWVENVTISNNVLRDIGFSEDLVGTNSYTPGAISVYASTNAKKPPFPRDNDNIVIESNIIDGCSVSGIHAYAVNRLIVRNNVISRVNQGDTEATGSAFLLSSQHAIELEGVSDPVIHDNKVSD